MKCDECLGEVPDEAKRCMHCGHRFTKTVEVNVIGGIVLAIAVIAMVYFIAHAY